MRRERITVIRHDQIDDTQRKPNRAAAPSISIFPARRFIETLSVNAILKRKREKWFLSSPYQNIAATFLLVLAPLLMFWLHGGLTSWFHLFQAKPRTRAIMWAEALESFERKHHKSRLSYRCFPGRGDKRTLVIATGRKLNFPHSSSISDLMLWSKQPSYARIYVDCSKELE